MNEPLISPWIFYFIGVCDNLKCTSFIFAVFLSIATIISGSEALTWDDERHNKYIGIVKRCACGLAATMLLFIFIPSSATTYKMVLAQHVTKANIIEAGETIDKALDKAVEKIINIKEKKK